MSRFLNDPAARLRGGIVAVTGLLALAAAAFAEPVISEFMASNEATVADEDGEFSDWIEIHNPTAEPVSLAQWSLTDTASNLTRWQFPDLVLEPGEFRLVWASGKNRRSLAAPLHTNFSLAAAGEYLALVRPDGSVQQEFAPSFPPHQADESFGLQFDTTTLVAAGSAASYRIAASAGDPAAGWQLPDFDDSLWASGTSGFGYGMNVPGITVRHVFKNGAMEGLSDAVTLASLPDDHPTVLSATTVIAPTVNFLGDFGGNHFEVVPPPGGSGDQYVIRATGFVEIPATGLYTFGLRTDDGGRITIDGTAVMVDDSFHGPEDRFGTIHLTEGSHSFEVIMFEGGGGDLVEFFAAPGQLASWDASAFRLVGDTANGGLAASTGVSGSGGVVATNLAVPMAAASSAVFRHPFGGSEVAEFTSLSLVMRHNDGFVAWLNGAQVASHHAPESPTWNATATASRTSSESLQRLPFNLSAALPQLTAGNNVLALHGFNAAAGDEQFLMLPELIGGSLPPGLPGAFYGPGRATPGWINGEPDLFGKVLSPTVDVSRGFFNAPFSLTLSSNTEGAEIRYTTDGSVPSASSPLYTAPLRIAGTTVLRTRAFVENWEPSPAETHTYLFVNDVIRQSPNGAPPPGWPAGSGTSQVLDYGMDPEIVDHSNPAIGGPAQVKSALLALPAVSVTTDLSNLFNIDGSQGIISNPHGRGLAWERPASMEWLNPPTAEAPHGVADFQIDAGIRVRGGFSRSENNPKHALRFLFRRSYGEGKLRFPLFGEDGASEFDKIDLRTAQNYSWSFEGGTQNTFLREESSRLTQLEMGQAASRVRYFHLFLNGQYWGLFNLDERPEAAFAESYFGGTAEEYDVVKAEPAAGYTTGATDGNLAAWQELFTKAKQHRASPTNANYFRLMGLAADGVTPTAEPVLLDEDNLIDYLLLTFWMGNLDGATSAFLGNNRANNWYGSRRRENNPRQGFRFFAHDFEHSLFNVNEDRTGPFPSDAESDFNFYNPMFLHQDLLNNAEYQMAWADRIQKHLFQEGALTTEAWLDRIDRLASLVDSAIIAESARWGDAKVSPPRTRQTWLDAKNSMMPYFPARGSIVLNQLRADGLYPAIDAPALSPAGGFQDSGTELVIAGPASATLYYMADGSDPRLVGGGIRSGALTHTASTTAEALVPWSADQWRYLADGSNLGTAWRTPAFNDTTWPEGTAELGYGDGDETTAIPVPANPKPATTYFRKSFEVGDLSGINQLMVRVEYDDAYAVYLNGARVAGNLPINPAYDSYTGAAIEETLAESSVDPALLVEGTNLIAVEIHQAAPDSSDITLNLSLTATRTTAQEPLLLTGGGEQIMRFRAKSGNTWSALTEATYLIDTEPASPANLAISKIMFRPANPSPAEVAAGFTDDGDFEFIELLNIGPRHVDLQGVTLSGGIEFDFTGAWTGRTLAPGARVLVVDNLAAFELRYGSGLPVAGVFSGNLSNSGEAIYLNTPQQTVLREVAYGVGEGWPGSASDGGIALVSRFPGEPAQDSEATAWRASGTPGGLPGALDPPAAGSFDAWAAHSFSPAQLASSEVMLPAADPDGDGWANFLEFALATDPLVEDRPGTEFVWHEENGLRFPALQFRRPADRAGLTYQLLASADLETWSVVASLATETPLADGLQQVVLRDLQEALTSPRFLRLQVSYLEP